MDNRHQFKFDIPIGGLGTIIERNGEPFNDVSAINIKVDHTGYSNVTLEIHAYSAIQIIAAMRLIVKSDIDPDTGKDNYILPALTQVINEKGIEIKDSNGLLDDDILLEFAERLIAVIIENHGSQI